MERFRFGEQEGPNGKRIVTVNGWLAVWGMADEGCSLEVAGPNGGVRALVVMDEATAGKLGAALLKWAIPNRTPDGCCYWPCELLGDTQAQLKRTLDDIEDFLDEDGEFEWTPEAGRKICREIEKVIAKANPRDDT